MVPEQIVDADSYKRAAMRLYALFDEGRAADAIAFAEGCEGKSALTMQLRATAYTDGGERLDDRETVKRGAELWKEAGIDHPQISYHAANAEFALWQLTVKDDGYVAALETSRHHLDRARELFATVGSDDDAGDELRLQALTNLGNSLDGMGRDVDAIDSYDQALAIDTTFGMALGNKATTLLGIVSITRDHSPALIREASITLDAAIEDRERIARIGGQSALKHFESQRNRIAGEAHDREEKPSNWEDPYLAWCFHERLFLHVSRDCLRPHTEILDPLFFRSVTVGLSDEEQARFAILVDAFDALKQDYIAARFTAWLTTTRDSPIAAQASDLASRTKFFDSLKYARWGLRTGMALQAFNATINLLDKIASFIHLYFEISRKPKVYFRTLWHPPTKKGKPVRMHSELSDQLEFDAPNRGLLALCDLSCDVERNTILNQLVERRHAATHRFLVAHQLPASADNESSEWLERVDWGDLTSGTLTQLRTARAALVYLARTVDIHEARKRGDDEGGGGVIPTMPLWPMEPSLSEID